MLGRASDPVVNAAVFFAEIDRSLEENHVAGGPAQHLDGVLVGTAAFTLERRLVLSVRLQLYFAVHCALSAGVRFGSGAGLRSFQRAPRAGPRTDHVGLCGGLL